MTLFPLSAMTTRPAHFGGNEAGLTSALELPATPAVDSNPARLSTPAERVAEPPDTFSLSSTGEPKSEKLVSPSTEALKAPAPVIAEAEPVTISTVNSPVKGLGSRVSDKLDAIARWIETHTKGPFKAIMEMVRTPSQALQPETDPPKTSPTS